MTSLNVTPSEINKFSNMAYSWWDNQGPCKPLHDINPIRLAFIENHAKLKDKKIIDIGCGGGILTEAMAKQGGILTGLDASKDLINIADLHKLEANLTIDYIHTTVEEFAQKHAETYDILTCMELLEHVPDPGSVIAACARLVKPGGQLFFSTINRNLKSFLHAIVGAEYILQLLPKGTHQYADFIKPSELDSYARDTDLSLQAVKGMGYNLLTRTYILTDSVAVNYLAYYRK